MKTPTLVQESSSISHATIIAFPDNQRIAHCAAVQDRTDGLVSCAIVHRLAFDSPFPGAYAEIASYIHGVFFPRLEISRIRWVEVVFEITARRNLLFAVSGVHLECDSSRVKRVGDALVDLTTHQTWIGRARGSVQLLLDVCE